MVAFVTLAIELCLVFAKATYEQNSHTVYVVAISWHSGIVLPGYAMPDSIWQRNENFSQYDFLEIGWGDRDFFQSERFNIWYSVKAIVWPTNSALHILPLPAENIRSNYGEDEIVRLELTDNELSGLVRYLLYHLELDEHGRVVVLGDGFYNHSQFVAGSSKYYFPKNSNVWTAKALKAAGFDLNPDICQTNDILLRKMRKLAAPGRSWY